MTELITRLLSCNAIEKGFKKTFENVIGDDSGYHVEGGPGYFIVNEDCAEILPKLPYLRSRKSCSDTRASKARASKARIRIRNCKRILDFFFIFLCRHFANTMNALYIHISMFQVKQEVCFAKSTSKMAW